MFATPITWKVYHPPPYVVVAVVGHAPVVVATAVLRVQETVQEAVLVVVPQVVLAVHHARVRVLAVAVPDVRAVRVVAAVVVMAAQAAHHVQARRGK